MQYAERSIEKGNTYALGQAALAYWHGIGTAPDIVRAHAYLMAMKNERSNSLDAEEQKVLQAAEQVITHGGLEESQTIQVAFKEAQRAYINGL
jgi:TPR repeat protein